MVAATVVAGGHPAPAPNDPAGRTNAADRTDRADRTDPTDDIANGVAPDQIATLEARWQAWWADHIAPPAADTPS